MRFLFATLFFLFATAAYSKTIKIDMQHEDTIDLNGVVTTQLMNPLIEKMYNRAGKTKNINIVINTPGGQVYAGQKFIQTMVMAKSRGTRISCVVTGMAASMGFQILSYCDRRFIMENSMLLWHPPRIQMKGIITPAFAKSLAVDLERLDKTMMAAARDNLDAPHRWYRWHHLNETMWLGSELNKELPGKFILVKDVLGLDTMLLKQNQFNFFGIVYINPAVLQN